MAVTIGFAAGEGFTVNNLAGNGLGWYSGAFGGSVKVGEYGELCYITDSTGSVENSRVDCCVPTGTSTGSIAGVSYNLRNIPNYLSTLNIYVTSDTPIKTMNPRLRIYNRVALDTAPSGVTVKAAEIIHTSNTADASGTGGATWSTIGGTTELALRPSPGTNGASPDGSDTTDTRHDHYIVVNMSPDSISTKLAALWFTCEYV